eukprot:Gb_39838 [translate_table: standard]
MSMKKGWRRYGAAVVCLVMLSMLVPLVFLLGLYGGFQTSYMNDEGLPTLNQTDDSKILNFLERNGASHQTAEGNHPADLGILINGLESLPSKVSKDGVTTKPSYFAANDEKHGVSVKLVNSKSDHNLPGTTDGNLDKVSETKHPMSGGFSNKSGTSSEPDMTNHHRAERKQSEKPAHTVDKKNLNDNGIPDDPDKACEFALGSYCLWSYEQREEMADSTVKMLKDQLFLARAYYPSIVKHRNREKLQRELRQHIQDSEHMLSEATADADLPVGARKKAKNMEGVLAKVKSYPIDCNNVVKKLGQILDATENEAQFHRKQSVFLYQLAVQTMSKSLHCLSMRLTVEYFRTYKDHSKLPSSKKLEDPNLYHYVIYSTNTLAASIVVNSTIIHAKEPQKHVFHLITDRQNYAAMKFWFSENTYGDATVHVQNLDDLNLPHSKSSMMASLSSEEFRVSIESPTPNSSDSTASNRKLRYLSVFNHPHFLLPEIFPRLNKVLFLDDDVVVQRDLTPLWSIDLQGKVNGAVEICEVRLHHLKKYLSASKFFSNGFDGSLCAWMSGMNIIDLQQWRKQELTKIYKRWLKLQNRYKVPWRFGTLPANLITFYNMTHGLDDSWLSFGLGHNFGIDQYDIENSAVLHYNGNLKPWLEIGINKYKPYWAKFLKQDDQFVLECNVNG